MSEDVSEKLPYIGASRGAQVGHGVHGSAMRHASTDTDLRAPFPWFGGKSRVAEDVWERFGDVANYVEPFAGSCAVLLSRPTAPRIETVNDLDCYIANFWRCLSALSVGCDYLGVTGDDVAQQVATFADWPVNEADLHARHRWLVGLADFRERMRRDPFYFDARVAGWWVWGLCAWIGSGWCSNEPSEIARHEGQRPHLGGGSDGHGVAGHGVHAKGMRLPMLGGSGNDERGNAHPGRGINRMAMREQLPNMGGNHDSGRGINALGVRSELYAVFSRLAARLRYTRVACGDWQRVLTDSVTWRHGTTGILLDPPYGEGSERADVYAHESATVAADVRAWCVEHGGDKRLRIALCGYAGEGHEALEALGWRALAWKAKGGYGGQRKKAKKGADGEESATNENAHRERVWFSPGCLLARQGALF